MSIWLQLGARVEHVDGLRLFGRPPVVTPPRAALARRMWECLGLVPDAPPHVEPADWCERATESVPAGTPRLTLAVPDATRTGPWRALLAPLLAALVRRVRPGGATMLVASGVHAPSDRRALLAHLFSSEADADRALDGWELLQNSEEGFARHRPVGVTPAGTPVRLHPRWVEADERVVLSGLSYHYLAGWGGGQKLVFPGLADADGARANHARALDERGELHPDCRPGRLRPNPMREDLDAAARLSPPTAWLVIEESPDLDPDPSTPEPERFTVGISRDPTAWEDALAREDRRRRVEFTVRPRVFVTDAGGAPRDSTFLQAHKSLQHATEFVPEGGRVLVAAECAHGWGSARLRGEDPDDPFHAWTEAALRRAARHATVGLWSSLPAREVERWGLVPLASRGAAETFLGDAGTEPFWGWLPRAERFLPAEGWLGRGAR